MTAQRSFSGLEVELKFQIPEAALGALRRAVATGSAQRLHLAAVYFDTEDRALSAAGLALRLRREGRHWVQTLKGRGDGLAGRLEHECELPPSKQAPALEIARHDGSDVGMLLRRALGARGAEALGPVYRTDVRRSRRVLRRGGARIELALDEGWLIAGPRRAQVREIEFELLAGPARALAELAARWALRHGLWWDVRTKSERGFRLALPEAQQLGPDEGVAATPVTGAVAVSLTRDATPAGALSAALLAALQQVLPNLAEIADGRSAPEHLHQLRVGLRRLRTVLRLFGPWAPTQRLRDEAEGLEAALRIPFSTLGATRDADVLAAGLWPRLQAAGSPPWLPLAPAPSTAAPVSPRALLAAPGPTSLLLGCLALALDAAATAAEPAGSTPLVQAAAAVLDCAWKAVRRDARTFAEAADEQRHRLRRRLKRLRYSFEALAPLFGGKAARRWLKVVRRALDALGAFNDIVVARELARQRVEHEPQAWFALGWLAAQQQLALADCEQALQALHRAPRPWR